MRFFKKKKEIFRSDKEIYLIRWNLFECRFFSIKIHRILLSDYNCLHDHPWSFISIILKGGYVETRHIFVDELEFETSRIFHPFQILYRKATDKHRLEIHQPATTLVITFKKVREWGFWTKLGFVPWFNYDSKSKCE